MTNCRPSYWATRFRNGTFYGRPILGGSNGRSATSGDACLSKNADALGSAASLAEELTNWDGTKKKGFGI